MIESTAAPTRLCRVQADRWTGVASWTESRPGDGRG